MDTRLLKESLKIIAENDFAVSTFDENSRIVRSTFKGRVKLDLAYEHMDELGEFYLNNKINGSIVNISKVYGSYAKILEYLKVNFLPKTKTSGIKRKAYVVSDDIIVAHLSAKLVNGDEYNHIKSKVFFYLKEAEEWVNETDL